MIEHYIKSRNEAEDICLSLLMAGDQGEEHYNKNRYNIVLSGGRSIIPVLDALRRLPDEILRDSYFYLADERIGSDYNQHMLKEQLFNDLLRERRITEKQLVFPDLSDSAIRTAQLYAPLVPAPNIVFLGVGEDGHIASLFPNHPILTSDKIVDVVTDSPKPPPERITMTYRAFSVHTVVVLLFFGSAKAEAFNIFGRETDFKKSPAAYFKSLKQLHIIHDQRSGG